MKDLTFPASKVTQGELVFYATSVKVKDLLKDGFYNVETLDPRSNEGFQRILEKSRAKKIADYIVGNIDDPKGVFIPTSIFLTTEKSIDFHEQEKNIVVNEQALPLNVVDGQHRLEGFRMAAEKEPRVMDYEIAVNICPEMPFLHQMCHFYIVNTTQKKVDDAIGQQIIARLTKELNVSEIPPMPKWMDRLVKMGDTDRALRITNYLNEADDSPWNKKIIMANEPKKKNQTIKQSSFHTSVRKHLTSASNPINHFEDDYEKQCRAILNYWKGIADCIQPDNDSVFFKYTGLEIFNKFATPFFMALGNNFTYEAVKEKFSHVCENLDGEHSALKHKDWWKKGGPASKLNAAAHPPIINAMQAALHKEKESQSIQV